MTTKPEAEIVGIRTLLKYWVPISGLVILVCGMYLAIDTHTKDIENLRRIDSELRQVDLDTRQEIKDIRKEQAESNRLVAEALSDIRIQLKEIVTQLKYDNPTNGK